MERNDLNFPQNIVQCCWRKVKTHLKRWNYQKLCTVVCVVWLCANCAINDYVETADHNVHNFKWLPMYFAVHKNNFQKHTHSLIAPSLYSVTFFHVIYSTLTQWIMRAKEDEWREPTTEHQKKKRRKGRGERRQLWRPSRTNDSEDTTKMQASHFEWPSILRS